VPGALRAKQSSRSASAWPPTTSDRVSMAGPYACRGPGITSSPGPGLHHMAAGAATSFTEWALGAMTTGERHAGDLAR